MRVLDVIAGKGGKVITASSSLSVTEAAKLMMRERIGALVVQNTDGQISGILSERDIVQGLATHGEAVGGKPISMLMRNNVLTCTTEDKLLKAMALMTDRRVRHVPILDQQNKLYGIISIGDVVKGYISEIESEADALREYINRS